MWAVAAVTVCLLVLAAAIFYSAWSRPKPFAPLGPYPEQQVMEPRNGQGLPVVSLDTGVVTVRGKKCADTGDYQITGTVVWQSIDPRGSSVRTGEGSREAPTEGGNECDRFTYENSIPEGVAAIMERQLNDGFRPVWRLTGTETPTSDTSGVGVPLTWVTEPFRVTR